MLESDWLAVYPIGTWQNSLCKTTVQVERRVKGSKVSSPHLRPLPPAVSSPPSEHTGGPPDVIPPQSQSSDREGLLGTQTIQRGPLLMEYGETATEWLLLEGKFELTSQGGDHLHQ